MKSIRKRHTICFHFSAFSSSNYCQFAAEWHDHCAEHNEDEKSEDSEGDVGIEKYAERARPPNSTQ